MTELRQRDIFGAEHAPDPHRSERARDRDRKRAVRAEASEIEIPPVADPARRERCRDPLLFLPTYFPHWFYMGFSSNQREMIAVTSEIMLYGGNQALAEPRGDGKTSIQEGMTPWGIFYSLQDFILYVSATGPEAILRFNELLWEFMHNPLLLADFPEFIYPIRALEGNSQRQKGQKCGGELTGLRLLNNELTFADIPGTSARGQKIETCGIESGIRGKKHRGKRPGYVMLDDPSTSESARSYTQNESRLSIIERDIAGTEDPSQKIACAALVTIIEESDLADQLTDRERNPHWQGIRRRMLESWPEQRSLWDTYVEMVKADMRGGDRFARRAHNWYLARRTEMDKGAVVSNPLRYFGRHMNYATLLDTEQTAEAADSQARAVALAAEAEREKTLKAVLGSDLKEHMSDRFKDIDPDTAEHLREKNVLPDGSEIEVSAVQHAFNVIAERGLRTFLSEYQNEPTTSGESEKRLTAKEICDRLSRLERGELPDDAEHLVMFIDVHKAPLWYVLMAAGESWPGSVIDYGAWPRRPQGYSWTGEEIMRETGIADLDGSIWAGLTALCEQYLDRVYTRDDGLELSVERCLIDSGWGQTTDTVYKFCRQGGWPTILRPSHGEFVRATAKPLHDVKRQARVRKGHNWVMAPAPGNRRVRLVRYDANYWKSFVHARLSAALGTPGSLSLFGADGKQHFELASHVLAERSETVTSKSRGRVEEWHATGQPNHLLDSLAGCCVALDMQGCQHAHGIAAIEALEDEERGTDGEGDSGTKAQRRKGARNSGTKRKARARGASTRAKRPRRRRSLSELQAQRRR